MANPWTFESDNAISEGFWRSFERGQDMARQRQLDQYNMQQDQVRNALAMDAYNMRREEMARELAAQKQAEQRNALARNAFSKFTAPSSAIVGGGPMRNEMGGYGAQVQAPVQQSREDMIRRAQEFVGTEYYEPAMKYIEQMYPQAEYEREGGQYIPKRPGMGAAIPIEGYQQKPAEPKVYGSGDTGYYEYVAGGQPRMIIPPAPRAAGGGGGKAPSGYRYTAGGELEPIPGGPADTKVQAQQQAVDSQVATIDTAITSLQELLTHPGRVAATGRSAVLNAAPEVLQGRDRVGFNSKLETFKSQMFVPMVSQLKGMGALSDAEGKRLLAAVGALNPNMSEEEFAGELNRIMGDLEQKKARLMGGQRQPMPQAQPRTQQQPIRNADDFLRAKGFR